MADEDELEELRKIEPPPGGGGGGGGGTLEKERPEESSTVYQYLGRLHNTAALVGEDNRSQAWAGK